LLHPIPSLLTTLAAMGFAWIFGIGPGNRRFWWIAAIMLLVQFSISALNEWADADLDRRAGRHRPIPLGMVKPATALGVAVVCAVVAFLLSVLVDLGTVALLLVGVGTACGWAYDLWLKPTPLSFLPFAIAFPLMPFWIGVLAGRPLSSLVILFLGGVPLATAIHLADAIPDRDRDRAVGLKTLAVALGRPGAEFAAAGLLLIGTLVSIVLILERGPLPVAAISIVTVAASGLVVVLSFANSRRASAPLGKWLVIAAAAAAAVPLVVSASGR
jgi:4-hydroxybenzoate polyprenyltransferase